MWPMLLFVYNAQGYYHIAALRLPTNSVCSSQYLLYDSYRNCDILSMFVSHCLLFVLRCVDEEDSPG